MKRQDLKNWILDFDLATSKPLVLGILNLTPDSFWDGGKYLASKNALMRVEQMMEEGVDILDIGGESTRPGSIRIDEKTEFERVIPVVKAIRKEFDVAISIDTYKPQIMQAALDEGADMINDVCALESEASIEIIKSFEAPVCLMHISGNLNDIANPKPNTDVIADILDFFQKKTTDLISQGLHSKQLIIDPGIGFGKTIEDNLKILKHFDAFTELNYPVLIGTSRKKFIGQILDRDIEHRLSGTMTTQIMSYLSGCRIFRVHDIRETKDCLMMAKAIMECE